MKIASLCDLNYDQKYHKLGALDICKIICAKREQEQEVIVKHII
jgi:hypothetical protein